MTNRCQPMEHSHSSAQVYSNRSRVVDPDDSGLFFPVTCAASACTPPQMTVRQHQLTRTRVLDACALTELLLAL